jgi:acetoin utilization deacetylase AcuC-like enzyme
MAYCRNHTVWVLEGGYNLQALADSALACLEVLLEESTDGGNPVDSVPDRGYNSGSPD